MTRKINGAKYEFSTMSTPELKAKIEELEAQIVPGKARELSPEARKANGVLRRKATNARTVLFDRKWAAGRDRYEAIHGDPRTNRWPDNWRMGVMDLLDTLEPGTDY